MAGCDLTALLQVEPGDLVPRDGGLDLDAIVALQRPLSEGNRTLSTARERLARLAGRCQARRRTGY